MTLLKVYALVFGAMAGGWLVWITVAHVIYNALRVMEHDEDPSNSGWASRDEIRLERSKAWPIPILMWLCITPFKPFLLVGGFLLDKTKLGLAFIGHGIGCRLRREPETSIPEARAQYKEEP